jgi:hypothetical protein
MVWAVKGPAQRLPFLREVIFEVELDLSIFFKQEFHQLIRADLLNTGRIRRLAEHEFPERIPPPHTLPTFNSGVHGCNKLLETGPLSAYKTQRHLKPPAHENAEECPGETCDREPLHTWRRIEVLT